MPLPYRCRICERLLATTHGVLDTVEHLFKVLLDAVVVKAQQLISMEYRRVALEAIDDELPFRGVVFVTVDFHEHVVQH